LPASFAGSAATVFGASVLGSIASAAAAFAPLAGAEPFAATGFAVPLLRVAGAAALGAPVAPADLAGGDFGAWAFAGWAFAGWALAVRAVAGRALADWTFVDAAAFAGALPAPLAAVLFAGTALTGATRADDPPGFAAATAAAVFFLAGLSDFATGFADGFLSLARALDPAAADFLVLTLTLSEDRAANGAAARQRTD